MTNPCKKKGSGPKMSMSDRNCRICVEVLVWLLHVVIAPEYARAQTNLLPRQVSRNLVEGILESEIENFRTVLEISADEAELFRQVICDPVLKCDRVVDQNSDTHEIQIIFLRHFAGVPPKTSFFCERYNGLVVRAAAIPHICHNGVSTAVVHHIVVGEETKKLLENKGVVATFELKCGKWEKRKSQENETAERAGSGKGGGVPNDGVKNK